MCLHSLYFSNIIVCSSLWNMWLCCQFTCPCLWLVLCSKHAPFICTLSDLHEANLGWLIKLITSFLWPLSLIVFFSLSSPGYWKIYPGYVELRTVVQAPGHKGSCLWLSVNHLHTRSWQQYTCSPWWLWSLELQDFTLQLNLMHMYVYAVSTLSVMAWEHPASQAWFIFDIP